MKTINNNDARRAEKETLKSATRISLMLRTYANRIYFWNFYFVITYNFFLLLSSYSSWQSRNIFIQTRENFELFFKKN